MRKEIKDEIKAVKAKGLNWTPARKFIDSDERLGALICSVCNNNSTHVQYSTFAAGRVVYCETHK